MKIKLVTIGEPKGDYKNIFNEFAKRIGRFAQFETIHIKENRGTQRDVARESEAVLKAIVGHFVVLLDEHGRELSSVELADFIRKKEVHGESSIAFVIGGTDGHTDSVRDAGDYSLALSRLTLPHDLAMVMTVEALYRALTITAGHPYHRV